MRYFLKELVNNQVWMSNGKPAPFVHGADDYGHLAIDESTPKGQELLTMIEEIIEKHIGGVFEVQEGRYEEEKKKAPFTRLGSGVKGEARLFQPNADPFRVGQSQVQQPVPTGAASLVQPVMARVDVNPAAVPIPAQDVVAQVASSRPDSRTFKPRTGKLSIGKQM